ncbi:MAG: hypothetical protein WD403_01045, partial [Pirellulales bacterium]
MGGDVGGSGVLDRPDDGALRVHGEGPHLVEVPAHGLQGDDRVLAAADRSQRTRVERPRGRLRQRLIGGVEGDVALEAGPVAVGELAQAVLEDLACEVPRRVAQRVRDLD